MWVLAVIGIALAVMTHPIIPDDQIPPADRPALAIMPLANYTSHPEAVSDVIPAIVDNLTRQKLRIIESGDLRQILRKHRIRALGAVDVDDIVAISEETGIRYLLFGSVDIYEDGNVPVAGISARILDINSMRLVWATSSASGGNDYSGLLGIGRIKSMDRLITRLIKDAFNNLDKKITRAARAPEPDNVAALVTFENYSDADYGGEILSNYILAELLARGIDVVEPVFLNNIFLENAAAPRGQINLPLLTMLYTDHGVDYAITGSLYRFRTSQNEAENSFSEIELSGRLLSTAEGRILSVFNRDKIGTGSSALINGGANGSLGKLTQKTVGEMLDSFEKATAKWMADK
jgi:TolB-like protein